MLTLDTAKCNVIINYRVETAFVPIFFQATLGIVLQPFAGASRHDSFFQFNVFQLEHHSSEIKSSGPNHSCITAMDDCILYIEYPIL